MAEEPVTDTEVLLELYGLLVTIKRILIALLVVVTLLDTTALFEWSRDRSQRNVEREVENIVSPGATR